MSRWAAPVALAASILTVAAAGRPPLPQTGLADDADAAPVVVRLSAGAGAAPATGARAASLATVGWVSGAAVGGAQSYGGQGLGAQGLGGQSLGGEGLGGQGLGGQCTGVSEHFAPNAAGIEADEPTAVAYTGGGARYLVAARASRNLTEYDASTGDFLRAIALSGSPQALAVAPDGSVAVTANVFEGTASVVDLATGAEVGLAGGLELPGAVVISADSSRAAIAAVGTQELVVVDLPSGTEVFRAGGLGFEPSLAFAPETGAVTWSVAQLAVSGSRALHTNRAGDALEVIDLGTGARTTLAVPAEPLGLAATPDGAQAVVTHVGATPAVSLIDLAAPAVVKTIALPSGPDGPVAVNPAASVAVVALTNAVVVVNLVTDSVGLELPVGIVYDLLTTADGTHALAVGFAGALIEFQSGAVVATNNGVTVAALGAVSPAAPEAILVGNLFGEDRLHVDTSGIASPPTFGAVVGDELEADATRVVAISLDGKRAVTTNVLSDSVSVWDLEARALLGVVAVGDRPGDVAITPDGTRAVVTNLESDFASIVDLDALTAAEVQISPRGIAVAIAPDGLWAYVAVAADGDGLWRIDIAGEVAVGVKLDAADMGSISYSYAQQSGIALSPDGARVALCGSFDDRVTIVDAANWAVLGNVDVTGFPVRAVWSADGSRCFVACRDADELAEVLVGAGPPTVGARIPVGRWPFELERSFDGSTLYLLEYLDQTIASIDVATLTRTAVGPLFGLPSGLALDPGDGRLAVSTGGWSVDFTPTTFSIDTFGTAVFVDSTTLLPLAVEDNGWGASDLAATLDGGRLALPTPRGDGLGFVRPDQAVVADTTTVSLAAGGQQSLCVDVGAGEAGQLYVVLGSASGSAPGLVLDGIPVPINVDAYTLATLEFAGSGPFVGTVGLLDALGETTAQIAVPAGTDPTLAGVELLHTVLAVDPVFGIVSFASEALALALAP